MNLEMVLWFMEFGKYVFIFLLYKTIVSGFKSIKMAHGFNFIFQWIDSNCLDYIVEKALQAGIEGGNLPCTHYAFLFIRLGNDSQKWSRKE